MMPVQKFSPHLFVIFGASGDLTSRKLVPALYHLMRQDDELRCCHIVGVARSSLSDAEFRDEIRDALLQSGFDDDTLTAWCDSNIHYQSLGPGGDDYDGLARRIAELESANNLEGNRVFYLALPPKAFPGTIEAMGETGLHESAGWTRLVIEKPFGRDLESALKLNDLVHRYFDESQIFRIDHYLGKESVQNLLVFRFANALFESAWHRGQIEEVEIAVHEKLGVGTRAGYYDESGALRDMIQNHLTQLLSLVGMEAPTRFDASSIRREKIKLLESVAPINPDDVIFGQYTGGDLDGEAVPSYRNENGVAPDSMTETFVQLRLRIANWRWEGVPFTLRTGKRLHEQRTRISIRFKRAPVSIFQPFEDTCDVQANVLVITLQPNEGFDLRFEVKKPRMPLRLDTQTLRFRYGEVFERLPDAYETLLLDILQGDQTLFVHADEVINSWRLYTPLLDSEIAVKMYPAGSIGPDGISEPRPKPMRSVQFAP
jgi:glucose-6-phosphate 1-dehydrogenase